MCSLSYFPLFAKNKFCLTHNRDERKERPLAEPPKKYKIGDAKLVFPRDPQGGGTWIASDGKTVACLLNGGFQRHERKEKYRQSRGVIIPNLFQTADIQQFTRQFDFEGIEPFTLVVFESEQPKLTELVWDEERLHLRQPDILEAHIWSSSTLYSDEIKAARQILLTSFLNKNPYPCPADILAFHQKQVENDPFRCLCLQLNEVVRTVAVTQVCNFESKAFEMSYFSLVG